MDSGKECAAKQNLCIFVFPPIVYSSFPPVITPHWNPQVCGGFLFLNNTLPTLQLWNKVGTMEARDEMIVMIIKDKKFVDDGCECASSVWSVVTKVSIVI